MQQHVSGRQAEQGSSRQAVSLATGASTELRLGAAIAAVTQALQCLQGRHREVSFNNKRLSPNAYKGLANAKGAKEGRALYKTSLTLLIGQISFRKLVDPQPAIFPW